MVLMIQAKSERSVWCLLSFLCCHFMRIVQKYALRDDIETRTMDGLNGYINSQFTIHADFIRISAALATFARNFSTFLFQKNSLIFAAFLLYSRIAATKA